MTMRRYVVHCTLVLGIAAGSTFFAEAQGSKHAQVFTAAEIQALMARFTPVAKVKGSSGAMLGNYGSHAIELSLRTASGGAEVHAHFDDVLIVTGGAAALVTGGTVIGGKTGADGETRGESIRGGTRQEIGKGDVVHVPACTPHQLLLHKGTLFKALVIKVRE